MSKHEFRVNTLLKKYVYISKKVKTWKQDSEKLPQLWHVNV